MPIIDAIPASFREDTLNGLHQPDDVYRVALFGASADLGTATTRYAAAGEVSGTGYTAGGITLAGRSVDVDSGAGRLKFANPVWPNSTLTARGALIYNATRNNAAVRVVDFGTDISSRNGTFAINFAAAGVVRYA